jgi:hypothetical protein
MVHRSCYQGKPNMSHYIRIYKRNLVLCFMLGTSKNCENTHISIGMFMYARNSNISESLYII